MSEVAVLDAQDVVVRYPGSPPVVAVDGVSLTVAPGETVALVGESGSGKSSLARAVVGIEKLAGGEVRFRDAPVTPLGIRRRNVALTGIQMVFQDPSTSLNPRRRVGDQIADGIATARARGAEGSTVAEWLERVGLPTEVATRFPHQFSGGQKQRLAIARALAARPSLLVADEPISALDASTQTSVAGLMRDLVAESGAGMLFISHDPRGRPPHRRPHLRDVRGASARSGRHRPRMVVAAASVHPGAARRDPRTRRSRPHPGRTVDERAHRVVGDRPRHRLKRASTGRSLGSLGCSCRSLGSVGCSRSLGCSCPLGCSRSRGSALARAEIRPWRGCLPLSSPPAGRVLLPEASSPPGGEFSSRGAVLLVVRNSLVGSQRLGRARNEGELS